MMDYNMKKQLFSFLLLITLAFSVSAQKAKKQSKTEKNLRTHVSYLASDKLEGRRTGEKGATFAAGYVANIFARYKLKGGVANAQNARSKGSFLQLFEYVSGVELGEDNSLKINGAKMNLKTDWLPIGFTPNADISDANIVFAGFGIESEPLKYNDYENVNVKDKIALVFEENPDKDNPHSEFGLIGTHAKANIAKQKGAKGLIIIAENEKFADERLAQLTFDQTLGEMAIPTIVISRAAAAKLLSTDSKGLQEIEKWFAKRTETPEPIQIKLAEKINAKAELKINLVKQKAEAYNVIGIVEGSDPVLKNEAIIIGAHYDHLGHGGDGSLSPNSNEIHHGADDNASGVSAMLELARQFREARKNKRTLIFIAFGGEEEGLLGSKAYTNNPVFLLDKTIAMINLDMVGRLNNDKLTVGGIGTAESWAGLVKSKNGNVSDIKNISKEDLEIKTKIENAWKNRGITQVQVEVIDGVAKLYGNLPKNKLENAVMIANEQKPKKIANYINSSIVQPKFSLQLNQDGFGPSDHSSFYAKKIPVLFFFTGTHTDYHKPSDTADKINYDGLGEIVGFVTNIVKAIDQNPKRPTYTVAKSSSTMGGRTSFNVSLGTIPSYADSDNTGLVLDGVRDDSAADKAGIKGGDKIIKIGDKEVRNISDYMFMLGEMKAGETYDVVVMRDGKKVMLKIVPDPRK